MLDPTPYNRLDTTDRESVHRRARALNALSLGGPASRVVAERPPDPLPLWLGELTRAADPRVSAGYLPVMAAGYQRRARRWHVLDGDAWERVRVAYARRCLGLAREAVTRDEWGVLPTLDEAERLLREGGSPEEWQALVRAAVRVAAEAEEGARRITAWADGATSRAETEEWMATGGGPRRTAAEAAATAAEVARAIAEGGAPWGSPEHGAEAASRAAEAAVAARWADIQLCAGGSWLNLDRAESAIRAATWDRITAGLLADLEREIDHD